MTTFEGEGLEASRKKTSLLTALACSGLFEKRLGSLEMMLPEIFFKLWS